MLANLSSASMKKIIIVLVLSFYCLNLNAQKNVPINLICFNVRYDNAGDGMNSWKHRKDNVKALIKFYDTDILCAQEVLAKQFDEILANTDFDVVGVGRNDGKRKGEFAPIYFNKKRFEKKDGGVFWLSETPDVPSKGWDAMLNRICTWVRLYDKFNKKEFLVFNTHYDHLGVQARIESAKLIKQKIQDIAPKLPLVFAGDLNVTPESEAITTIKTFLSDSKEVSEEAPYGPEGTFNGFKFNASLAERIDYVFVNNGFRVKKYAALTDSKEQKYFSDHLPVFVKLIFK